ncbi:phosphotransferase [Actinomadura barringtoniae]|uniref:Phosphotransferase n=1 Tax=Actinomadura barringtoniae TaxID=1427535 RepID=A0A939PM47_9ACTN|nr:phosphotransferase [Actinomadura barringtoniae]MBO2452568.1 phosphotransferase [Actinomadura barringtoniae]
MRSDWSELPDEVRDAVEDRTGPIDKVQPASAGIHADIASTVSSPQGKTFVKAARKLPDQDGPEVRSLRREATITPYMSELAPRLLWKVEVGGWLALGFDHVNGRHADYAPGSPDLAVLAKMVNQLQNMACPDAVEMRVERRWKTLADDVTAIAGNALLHTDLNPANILLTPDGRTYVVDWGFTSRGAPWIEMGQIIPWLIRAGHSPAEAEDWAGQFTSWTTADPAAIDMYARVSAERWRRHNAVNPTSREPGYLKVARQWADYRRRR